MSTKKKFKKIKEIKSYVSRRNFTNSEDSENGIPRFSFILWPILINYWSDFEFDHYFIKISGTCLEHCRKWNSSLYHFNSFHYSHVTKKSAFENFPPKLKIEN